MIKIYLSLGGRIYIYEKAPGGREELEAFTRFLEHERGYRCRELSPHTYSCKAPSGEQYILHAEEDKK